MVVLNTGEAAHLVEQGTEIELVGPPYLDVLARLHTQLRPRTYLEIGTWEGASLRIAKCASLAVDPSFQLEDGVVGSKPLCVFHQTTSDDFFKRYDPAAILGGPVDLAFIDALHVFEFALRDFIGTERSCLPSSMIALDDCCPRDFFMARRTIVPDRPQPTRYEGYWTGDVWKIIPVLREYRPDIRLICLDTRPTGLTIAANLNPDDHTLATKYDEIVERWRDVKLEEYGMARLLEDLRLEAADHWVAAVRPLHPDDPVHPVDRRTPVPTARQQLEAISLSKSWRLTSPLRAIGHFARKVGARRGGAA